MNPCLLSVIWKFRDESIILNLYHSCRHREMFFMPPRLAAIAIVVFWLATMGWMFYRETWPHLGADKAPPLYFDMGDEVERHIRWSIWRDGKNIGFLDTRTKRTLDRTYKLRADYTFRELV